MAHVCSWRHVWTFDNFLRPLIHDPHQLFGPYVRPGMTVMDIGCGAGFATIGLARLVGSDGRVVAVDLQRQMLSMVEKRARRSGLTDRIETRRCQPQSLEVAARFDFINAFWMVHEVPDTPAFFDQVHACLHPDGKFLVTEPKFHVSAAAFARMRASAADAGLIALAQPAIRFSRAVLFGRQNDSGENPQAVCETA